MEWWGLWQNKKKNICLSKGTKIHFKMLFWVELNLPKKRYVEVLTPSTLRWDIIWDIGPLQI